MEYVYNKNLSYTNNKNTKEFIRRNKNILIVDDDIKGAECLKEILEIRGHYVTIIDDAVRCITLCETNYYDIVFMDYHMEGLDGSQVTSILKDQKISKTIIYAFTGDNSKYALDTFKEAGMNGAIIKPIDVNILEILLNYLEEHNDLDSSQIINITKKSNKTILFF